MNKEERERGTYYELKLWVPPELTDIYVDAVKKHNFAVLPYISGRENAYFDAGFDLFCPEMTLAPAMKTTKINHLVRSSMRKIKSTAKDLPISNDDYFDDMIKGILNPSEGSPVGYYLYPRSSTGTKTPLRLANSVGSIDSGYRGDIIAAFDNWSSSEYVVDASNRVVQLCPPDLTYPIYVRLVDNIEDLGHTVRGKGGFGSTGK